MSMFTRGYEPVREKVEKGSKFIRICQNCLYFGKKGKMKESECLNNDVTKYDLIFDGGNVSCTQWTPYTLNKETSAKRCGRDAFDDLIEEEI